MLVTVFTPTYNRGYIITNLYESLLAQINTDFEWLVIDDGSTDDTEAIINIFISQKKIQITYIRIQNGGKQSAINKGVQLAQGELFFIVDSDDYLTDDAICKISIEWGQIPNKEVLGGLCFRKVNYTTGEVIGGVSSVTRGNYTSLEITYTLGIVGDKAEIFRTGVLLNYPFPHFDHETFVPEALVWNRISKDYCLRFVDIGIYMCEYLEDGLSANFAKNLKFNSRGFGLYYKEVLSYSQLPFVDKIKCFVRFLQCRYFTFIK